MSNREVPPYFQRVIDNLVCEGYLPNPNEKGTWEMNETEQLQGTVENLKMEIVKLQGLLQARDDMIAAMGASAEDVRGLSRAQERQQRLDTMAYALEAARERRIKAEQDGE